MFSFAWSFGIVKIHEFGLIGETKHFEDDQDLSRVWQGSLIGYIISESISVARRFTIRNVHILFQKIVMGFSFELLATEGDIVVKRC